MSSQPELSGSDTPLARSLTVIMPVYNDWQSAALLIRDIGIAMAGGGYAVGIVAVDDGSTEPRQQRSIPAPVSRQSNAWFWRRTWDISGRSRWG